MTSARIASLALLLLASGCLTVRMTPDRAEYDHFAPVKRGTCQLSVTPLELGRGHAPRCAAASNMSCLQQVAVVHVAYLVRHGHDTFLIDAPLPRDGHKALEGFSGTERAALNFTPEHGLAEALAQVHAPSIDFVLLTHSHWDHVSGLPELPHPRVFIGPGEGEFIQRFREHRNAKVPVDALSGAELVTVRFEGPGYENFPASHDVFGDGCVTLLPMPGHTPGSMGVMLDGVRGKRLLFVGDTAWTLDAVHTPSNKLRPVSDKVDDDRAVLDDSLWRLHHLAEHDPALVIVPAHDEHGLAAVRALQ